MNGKRVVGKSGIVTRELLYGFREDPLLVRIKSREGASNNAISFCCFEVAEICQGSGSATKDGGNSRVVRLCPLLILLVEIYENPRRQKMRQQSRCGSTDGKLSRALTYPQILPLLGNRGGKCRLQILILFAEESNRW
jgi:hypothetical protein